MASEAEARRPLLATADDSDEEVLYVTDPDLSTQKRKTWTNLVVLSVSFMFVFTAFTSIQNLQSSLNTQQGLGTSSLSVVYGGLVLSCIFAPLIVKKLSCKWTFAVGWICHCLFTGSNFYPQFYTLIPTSFLLGMASGPIWTAQGTYITALAVTYARVVGATADVYISRFNGIFFLFFQSSQVWGNLVSYFILQSNSTGASANETAHCGRDFCPTHLPANSSNSTANHQHGTSHNVLYLLMGIYAGSQLIGFLTTTFVMSNVSTEDPDAEKRPAGTFKDRIVATVRAHKDPRLSLLIPMFIFSGLEQALIFADFTEAFVTCTLGIHMVGLVMIAFGITDALSCVFLGRIEKYTTRIPLFVLATCINASLMVVMLLWTPVKTQVYLFFLIPALWAVSDAVWNSGVSSMLGAVFKSDLEPAFASFRLWQSVGFAAQFGYSTLLCVYAKVYIGLGMVSLQFVLYVIVEILVRRRRDSELTVQ